MGLITATYNLSLRLIPVSFLNTMKASIPIWTCLVCRFWFGQKMSYMTYVSILLVVAGLAMASAAEVSYVT